MENNKEVILVTGSSGFIGHALCHHFASEKSSNSRF